MRTIWCILGKHKWSQWYVAPLFLQKIHGLKEYRYCTDCGYTERR